MKNKILLDKEYYNFKDKEIFIEIKKKNITIEIEGNVIINDINTKEDYNVKYILKDNCSLTINSFYKDIVNVHIEFEIGNNTNLLFNQSIYTLINTNYEVLTTINGSNNNLKEHIYAATNLNGNIKILASGNVKENIINNDYLEDVKIMSLNDAKNIIYPDLLVSSNEVCASHNATMSNVREDDLMYLMSKGLSKDLATNLLVSGFLFNKLNLDEEIKNKIKF